MNLNIFYFILLFIAKITEENAESKFKYLDDDDDTLDKKRVTRFDRLKFLFKFLSIYLNLDYIYLFIFFIF